jgi:hypothetical protein
MKCDDGASSCFGRSVAISKAPPMLCCGMLQRALYTPSQSGRCHCWSRNARRVTITSIEEAEPTRTSDGHAGDDAPAIGDDPNAMLLSNERGGESDESARLSAGRELSPSTMFQSGPFGVPCGLQQGTTGFHDRSTTCCKCTMLQLSSACCNSTAQHVPPTCNCVHTCAVRMQAHLHAYDPV